LLRLIFGYVFFLWMKNALFSSQMHAYFRNAAGFPVKIKLALIGNCTNETN